MVSVRRGERFFDRMHCVMWWQCRQSLLENLTLMTGFSRLSMAGVQLILVCLARRTSRVLLIPIDLEMPHSTRFSGKKCHGSAKTF
jgi:hypothetical protein